jgi:hypothetical protein
MQGPQEALTGLTHDESCAALAARAVPVLDQETSIFAIVVMAAATGLGAPGLLAAAITLSLAVRVNMARRPHTRSAAMTGLRR